MFFFFYVKRFNFIKQSCFVFRVSSFKYNLYVSMYIPVNKKFTSSFNGFTDQIPSNPIDHKQRAHELMFSIGTNAASSSLQTILKPCLFSGIHFPENHFPNFPVFVCH